MNEARQVLYRVDMEDATGVHFCEACAEDASESGLFVECQREHGPLYSGPCSHLVQTPKRAAGEIGATLERALAGVADLSDAGLAALESTVDGMCEESYEAGFERAMSDDWSGRPALRALLAEAEDWAAALNGERPSLVAAIEQARAALAVQASR